MMIRFAATRRGALYWRSAEKATASGRGGNEGCSNRSREAPFRGKRIGRAFRVVSGVSSTVSQVSVRELVGDDVPHEGGRTVSELAVHRDRPPRAVSARR